MNKGMTPLANIVRQRTIENRDATIKEIEKWSTQTIILYLLETMKAYSQDENCLTGQYMMTLDAIQTTLTKRNIIKDTDTWTLEEFLNDVPFHSDIVTWRTHHEE